MLNNIIINIGFLITTEDTTTIRNLLWRSSDDFKDKTATLLKNDIINVNIRKDVDYNLISQHKTIMHCEPYYIM